MTEEEAEQRRAEKQLRREQLEVRDQQLAQRDEVSEQVVQRLQKLEEVVGTSSRTSHVPPSSDRFVRQPNSVRQRSGKKPGGQEGHEGQTHPCCTHLDTVTLHGVEECPHCQHDLTEVTAQWIERRQVGDVPPIRVEVHDHQAEHTRPLLSANLRGPLPTPSASANPVWPQKWSHRGLCGGTAPVADGQGW